MTGNRTSTKLGLTSAGVIELTKRADLVQISLQSGVPVVRRVWREGIRVL
jgi:alpha-D-ribose 1-methylphosphonate 5-triphosphate diphosphatase